MKHGIVGQCPIPCLGSALCIDYVLGGGELVEKVESLNTCNKFTL